MIGIGRIQDLRILRRLPGRLVLGDDDRLELVVPDTADRARRADTLRVFVHLDRDGKPVATTTMPKAEVGRFATMRVLAARSSGVLVDWGVEPALLVPREEQHRPLEEGRSHVVRVYLDEETGQVRGSTRVERFLDNTHLSVQPGDQVDLLVFGRSELGFSVVVNERHQGLVHANEVFKPIAVGDRIVGYVKNVREDHKLDITLQPIGYRRYIDAHTALVAERIQAKNGFLPLSDKSSAEDIHAEFGISKKAFKKALGALYKDRLVRIGDEGVTWIG